MKLKPCNYISATQNSIQFVPSCIIVIFGGRIKFSNNKTVVIK